MARKPIFEGSVGDGPDDAAPGDRGNDTGAGSDFIDLGTDPGAVFGGTDGGGDGSGGGSADGDDFAFDPERHIGRDKRNRDGSYRRKRKRGNGDGGSGSGGRKRKGVHPLNADAATAVLFGIHAQLSVITNSPNLAITEKEARMLGEAAANVAEFYPVQIDPKIWAWGQLGIAGFMVYGPRIYNAMHERRARRAQKVDGNAPRKAAQPAPSTVVEFPHMEEMEEGGLGG